MRGATTDGARGAPATAAGLPPTALCDRCGALQAAPAGQACSACGAPLPRRHHVHIFGMVQGEALQATCPAPGAVGRGPAGLSTGVALHPDPAQWLQCPRCARRVPLAALPPDATEHQCACGARTEAWRCVVQADGSLPVRRSGPALDFGSAAASAALRELEASRPRLACCPGCRTWYVVPRGVTPGEAVQCAGCLRAWVLGGAPAPPGQVAARHATCPRCRTTFVVPEQAPAGHPVQCTRCGEIWDLPGALASPGSGGRDLAPRAGLAAGQRPDPAEVRLAVKGAPSAPRPYSTFVFASPCPACAAPFLAAGRVPAGSLAQCERCGHTWRPPPPASPLTTRLREGEVDLLGGQPAALVRGQVACPACAAPRGLDPPEPVGTLVQCARCLHVWSLAAQGSAPALRPPAPPQDEAVRELLARVLAAPDDDGPRLVLADLLLERGEPRGRFIALQVEHARSPPDLHRKVKMNVLQRDHGARWLPPGVRAETAVFRRGFLHEAEWTSGTAPDHPEWRLVEVLRGAGGEAHGPSVLAVPRPRLRVVTGASALLLAEVLQRPPPGLEELDASVEPQRFVGPFARELKVLPRLRRLGVRWLSSGGGEPVGLVSVLRALGAYRWLDQLALALPPVDVRTLMAQRSAAAPELTLQVYALRAPGAEVRLDLGPAGIQVTYQAEPGPAAADARAVFEGVLEAVREAQVSELTLVHQDRPPTRVNLRQLLRSLRREAEGRG